MEDEDKKPKSSSVIKQIIAYLKGNGELWISTDGEYFVTVGSQDLQIGTTPNSPFGRWATKFAFDNFGYISSRPFLETLNSIVLRMVEESPLRYKLENRVGGSPDAILVDNGEKAQRFYKITPKGWNLVDNSSPYKFIRSGAMLPYPKPALDAKPSDFIDLLRKYIRVAEDDLCLLAMWVIGAYKPGGPFPVLLLTGEQGSAKSSTMRLLRRLVDPHMLDMREPFEDARDILPAIRNSYVLAFDNVSILRNWFSDTICRISTGTGALGGRTLYTNSEETAFTVCRPIAMNGIPDFVERGDLIDRAIHIHLPTIPANARMDDDSYWSAFATDWPVMWGGLLNGLVETLRELPNVTLTELPRMSNFAKWAVAAEQVFGFRKGTFLPAYVRNRERAENSLVEFNGVASAIMRMFEGERAAFHGTYEELIAELEMNLGPREKLPQTSHGISAELRRIAPALKKLGLSVYHNGRRTTGQKGKGRMLVEIQKEGGFKSIISELIN